MTSSYEAFQPEAYSPVQYAAPQGPKQAFDKAALIAREYQAGEQRNTSFYNQPSINNQVNEVNRKRDSNMLEQRINYKQEEFELLKQFSGKLVDKAVQGLTALAKANQARGAALQATGGLTPEDQEAQQAELQQLRDEESAVKQMTGDIGTDIGAVEQNPKTAAGIASKYRKIGENRIASMGYSERVGYVQAYMTQRKADYKADLGNAMATDNKTILIDSNNNTFTPASATTTEQVGIASRAVTGKLVTQYGIAGSNPNILEEMFYKGKDGARESLTKYVTDRNKAISVDQGQKAVKLAAMEVGSDIAAGKVPNLTNLLNTLRSTVNDKNQYRTNNEAVKDFQGLLEGMIDAAPPNSNMSEKLLEGLAASRDTQFTDKSMLEVRGKLAAHIKDYQIKKDNDRYTASEKQADIQWEKQEEGYKDIMLERFRTNQQFTKKDLETMQLELIGTSSNKGRSKLLDTLYSGWSQQTVDFKANERIALQKIANGTWTEQDAIMGGQEIFKKYGADGRRLDTARSKTGNFTDIRTTVEATVRLGATNLGENVDLPWTAKLVSNKLYEQIMQRGLTLSQDPKYQGREKDAYYDAMGEVLLAAKEKGLGNSKVQNGLYSDGLRGNFPQFTQQFLNGKPNATGENVGGVTGTYEAVKKRNEKLQADLTKYNGLSAVDNKELGKTEQPYVSTADLEANGQNYDARNWTPLATVTKLMESDGSLVDPLALTNRLRVSRGLPELPPPPSLKLLDNTPTPEVQQAIRNLSLARTPQQVVRAGSQMGQFVPEMVPYGLGKQVVSAASKTNNSVQPIEIAAVAGVESGTRDIGPGHANYNGDDNGVMQINQAAHPGYIYKPGDTQGNLDYGAQVLAQTKAEAVTRGVLPEYQQAYSYAAYNAGGGSIPVVNGVPQFQNYHKDYIRKVYRQLGRYGDRSVYSSPFTMREDFLARQATHPDTGAGYTADGAIDGNNRPVILAEPALMALAVLVEESGGAVKWSDIQSAQRSPAKNAAVGGVPGSNHLSGNAVDIHGTSRVWMKENGAQYGWIWNDYMGPDGWHFDFEQ